MTKTILCGILFFGSMIFYTVYLVRKAKRDYQEMIKQEEFHAKWMEEMRKFKR